MSTRCKGEGVEIWHPRFRGNATRWVQVEGFPGTPTKDSFAGLVTHTDHEPVGEFACSNELVNRIYQNARWGTRLQNRSVPMEPDRDERMPWSGHPAKTSESEGWAFNVARFYEHFLHNYRVHQAEDGSLQEILPPYWLFNSKDIIWPSVVTIIPDWYYNFYGDDRLLRDNYDMMKRFVLYHEQTESETGRHDGPLQLRRLGRHGFDRRQQSQSWSHVAAADGHGLLLQQLPHRRAGRDECSAERMTSAISANLADRVYEGFNQRFFDAAPAPTKATPSVPAFCRWPSGWSRPEHRQAVIDNLVQDIMVEAPRPHIGRFDRHAMANAGADRHRSSGSRLPSPRVRSGQAGVT